MARRRILDAARHARQRAFMQHVLHARTRCVHRGSVTQITFDKFEATRRFRPELVSQTCDIFALASGEIIEPAHPLAACEQPTNQV